MPVDHVPAVSVCIPTYRGIKYLRASIDSILAQTFSDFELIIIDDNSPDGTSSLITSYSDPRIRYIRNPVTLGPEMNWNRCLAEARGKYFKLLPHDDVLRPACLEQQLNLLERDTQENLALVFCAREVIGPADQTLRIRSYPGGRPGLIHSRLLVRRCVRYGTNLIGEPGGILLRRKLALEIGLFDGTHPYVVDLDYWFRLLIHGNAYYIPEPLVAFRVSEGSLSVKLGTKQTLDVRALINKIAINPAHPISYLDVAVGRQMARVNTIMRLLFYRLVLKGGYARRLTDRSPDERLTKRPIFPTHDK